MNALRLFTVFLAHEVRTQLRSLRFAVLSGAFIAFSLAPPVAYFFIAKRPNLFISEGTFAASTFFFEPLLATLFSAILAIDGISRERDENSFRVVSLAPLSNVAYLTHRLLAIETIAIAVTLVPPVGAWTLAGVTHDRFPHPGLFFLPWILKIVPLSLSVSAMAIAFGTIMGAMVPAVIVALLVFGMSFGFVNNILVRYGRVIPGPVEWLGLTQLDLAFALFDWTRRGRVFFASDAAYDVSAAIVRNFREGAIFLGYAALFFGLAAAFLRRTRPNVRPWPIRPDHPLRTTLRMINRWREELTPDPKLGLGDRLVILSGVLLFCGMLGWSVHLDDRYRALAAERYAAEASNGPEPTPVAIVPLRWVVRGRIAGREIQTTTAATLRNVGANAESHLAFTIDPLLAVVRVGADAGSARFEKRWNRLAIDLDPPIRPGESRTLRIALRGRPGEIDFPFRRWGSFVEQYRYHVIRGELPLTFAETMVRYAIEPAQIDLPASSIVPVPRFASWKLITRGESAQSDRWFVPPESFFPRTEIDVEIDVPSRYFVADACGSFRRQGSGVLRSRCAMPIGDFGVVGGELEHRRLGDSAIAYASLPGHSEVVALRASLIAEAADAARKAWSGVDPLRGAIVVEISPRFHSDRFQAMLEQNWFEGSQANGRIFRLLEADLTGDEGWSPEYIAGVALASELTQRRAVAAEHASFFNYLYRELARERLGKGRPQRAVVGPNDPHEGAILKGAQWYTAAYRQRLPAVLADIENRVGSRLFDRAIDRFVNTPSAVPATARDLVGAIERESGVSLERMWQDYFVGDGVPQLTLEGVEFAKRGDEWIISGSLRNKGVGEAVCPLVLRTDFESAQTVVTVDTNESRPFTLRTPYHPRTLQLDPENVCYRFAAVGLVDRGEYEGGS